MHRRYALVGHRKISEEIQTQERENTIAKPTYAAEIRGMILESKELPTYLKDDDKVKNETSTIARFTLGCSRVSQYWRTEEDRKYRICEEMYETMQHIPEECNFTGEKNSNWREIMENGNKNLSKLNSVMWKRINRERRENEGTTDPGNENSGMETGESGKKNAMRGKENR